MGTEDLAQTLHRKRYTLCPVEAKVFWAQGEFRECCTVESGTARNYLDAVW